ncbi:MAG TPA: hypothetical protein VMZ26_07910 [Pyrinomonadaceae bacterium]|nr:hypothetical protein [Pyrinomonadaceae bacterium]
MKRIILAISVLLVLGLAVAAIALNPSGVTQTAAASCCSHGADSCPTKKDGSGKETASCCDEGCCKGDSCPMKKGGDASAQHPDSCPMKHKDGQASHATMTDAEHQAMKADGKSCCDCCGAKQDA